MIARRGAALSVVLLLLLSACATRKPRWNYGSLDQGEAASQATASEATPVNPDAMERLLVDMGCTSCHTFHGERLVGPPLDRLGGATRRFRDGTTGVVDEAYIVESLFAPERKVVEGYDAIMPAYAGHLDETDAEALARYLITLH